MQPLIWDTFDSVDDFIMFYSSDEEGSLSFDCVAVC